MKRIPRHVLARNRQAGYADEQAAGYREQPRKPGGPCARCGKPEDDHFAGMCDDWKAYTPKKPAEAAR